MYFPYLRGRQYELLALREIAANISENGKIIPIIEPVKLSSTTVASFDKFVEGNMPFVLIVNPLVGDLTRKRRSIKKDIIENVLDEYDNFYIGFLITHDTTLQEISNVLNEYSNYGICLIHWHSLSNTMRLISMLREYDNISYQIFYDGRTSADYRNNFTVWQTVLLRDEFVRQARNADYGSEEFFSDLYKTYGDAGFAGFGDFLTVGDEYTTGGPAHAVVIHYTYLNGENNDDIWVKHFVSDRTELPIDPGGKFLEALRKCISFLNQENSDCESCDACQEFVALETAGHFPGLGYVKKLSMKHHIQLMSKLV